MRSEWKNTLDSPIFISDDFMISTTTLISRTAHLYSENLGTYIMMIGLIQFVLGLLADLILLFPTSKVRPFYLATEGTDPFSLLTSALNLIGFSSSEILLNLIVSSAGVVVMAVFCGGITKFGISIYRDSSKRTVKESLSFACKRARTLISIQLILGFLILSIALPILVLLVQGIIQLYPIRPYLILNDLITYLPLLLLCLSGITYINVRLTLAPVAAIAEDMNTIDSLKKSWELTKGNSFHVFKGIFILMVILGTVTSALIFMAVLFSFGFSVWITLVPAAINQILLSPIYCAFQVVLYMDLLSRKHFQSSNWWNHPTMNREPENGGVTPFDED